MKNFNPEILDQEGQEILFARVASNLLKEGKTEQATLISEVGIKKFPDYAQGHFVLAKCYQEKDMYEEARTEYERVLKYDSSHLGALKELSGLFLSSGLSDVYKDYLFRLLTLDPLNHSILDEAREQGVYDIWKSQGAIPFSKVEKIEPNEIGDTKEPEKEQNEKVDESITSQEDNLDDMAKMDLSQFENQEDDFNTIMDGLIQDSADENEETESLNYLEELETPVELENELLAEEKPVLDEDDIEMTTFDDSAEDEKKFPFMEMDFSDSKESNLKEQQSENIEQTEMEAKDETSESEEPIEIIDDAEEKEETVEKPEAAFEFEEKSELELIDEEPDLVLDETPEEEIISINEINDALNESEEKVPELKLDEGDEEIVTEVPQTKTAEIEENIDELNAEENPYVKQKIVSQTLGEILVSQKKYTEAKQVFLALKEQQPDNQNIDKKIDILDKIISLEKTD